MNTIKMLETTTLANDSLQDDTWADEAGHMVHAAAFGAILVGAMAITSLAVDLVIYGLPMLFGR